MRLLGSFLSSQVISVNLFWWLEVVGAAACWRSSVLVVESSALFCGGQRFCGWWSRRLCSVVESSVLLLLEYSAVEYSALFFGGGHCSVRGCLCGFGPEEDIYTNSQGSCSIQNRGKAYANTFATLVDENKRQKIELDSQKKVLDDVQEKLTLEQAKSKKQTKKVHKYAKATQDIQAQMFQWHSLMKTILPNLPPPIPVIDSLSESEDGGEDENDDDGGGGGGGVDE
ncbi:hypothetical protein Cgig2_019379 [Carnegiea gigantea]|uniref:Uncharacterized protein n=1 Tax=Carnegiea gigantea TaxID=171969 RepID=A0A9Q1KBF3_9CARY|nr:hypothetical protein Cgig2_019379 [Carnegiea gigantea]